MWVLLAFVVCQPAGGWSRFLRLNLNLNLNLNRKGRTTSYGGSNSAELWAINTCQNHSSGQSVLDLQLQQYLSQNSAQSPRGSTEKERILSSPKPGDRCEHRIHRDHVEVMQQVGRQRFYYRSCNMTTFHGRKSREYFLKCSTIRFINYSASLYSFFHTWGPSPLIKAS